MPSECVGLFATKSKSRKALKVLRRRRRTGRLRRRSKTGRGEA